MNTRSSNLQHRSELTLGTRWVFDGQLVQIDGITSGSTVSVRTEATGAINVVPVAALQPVPTSEGTRDIQSIASDEWARIAPLAQDIRPLAEQVTNPGEQLRQLAAKHYLSVRHIQRLITRFRASPRTSTLAKRKRGRRKASHFLKPPVEQVIQHVIQKYYLVRERTSESEITARARSICRRLGLRPPSAGSVRRRIADHQTYQGDLCRLGNKQAKQARQPRPGQLCVVHPLDLVQIDHTLVDVFVLSNDRTIVLGRPWLTVAVDIATRTVLGFYLSMDAPSSVAVGLCIAHAVLPKPEDAREPGLWPMFGKMKVILVDNGKDLVSEAIRRGCEEHGIALQTRPVGEPQYGGHVERLIGTLMQMVHGLQGTTFSSVKDRKDYPSERKATMTLWELHEWLLQKIARAYHVRTHRVLGVPPLVAWERAWRTDDGAAVLPPLVAHPDEFRLTFLPFVKRRLQRTGIQFRRSRYWAEPLACWVHPERVLQIHYDPRNLSRIWVRTPDDHTIQLEAVAGRAAGQPQNVRMDTVESARIDVLRDAGFEATERLERMAASAKRAQQRRQAKSPRQPGAGPTSNQVTGFGNEGNTVPLDRSSVHVKRID
ncbi:MULTISPECIES: Mu transposase C-terminal domain-containing protein [Dyella]|uniref:Transposase n=2 Tax=Dyella TaxID=231454 RepID=A0A4R0YWR9_9GAMM|nr:MULTISPECIES: Mu transposase C-terminal domain-containing protein [Dyella]TBR39402.1 transposase [Dyella terrae]TCI13011.1 transposase [Dyella soli]